MEALKAKEIVVTQARGWPQRWWRLFPFAFFFMMTMQIDKINVNFMYVHEPFMRHFDLVGKPERLGLLTGGFLFAYGFCAVLWGPMIQRWGGRFIGTVGIIAWALIMLLHSVASSYWELVALRIALGFVESCALPLLAWFTSHWLPFNERARGQAPWPTGISIGSTITPVFVIWLLGHMAWETTFYIFAALPLIPFVLLFRLADDPAAVSGMPASELEIIKRGALTNELDVLKLPEKRVHTFFQTLSSYRVWLIGLVGLGSTTGAYALGAFAPIYLVQVLHFPKENMSYVLSGGALLGAICAIMLAIDSDRRKRRAWHGFGIFTAGAIFLALSFFTAPSAIWTAVALSLASACATPALVIIWSLSHSVAERTTIASTVGAIATCGVGMAGIINIGIGSLIHAHGNNYAIAFVVVLFFYVLSAVSAFILARQSY